MARNSDKLRLRFHGQAGQTVVIEFHAGTDPETPTVIEPDTPLPEKPIQPLPTRPSAKLTPCQKAIVVTLCECGRLTQAKLVRNMEQKGRRYSESAVAHALAALVKMGLLNNRQDQDPPGYDVLLDDAE